MKLLGDVNMNIGYIRVSTEEQNTIRQEHLMQELHIDKCFIDKVSGKNTERPELNKLLEFARTGDTIIVESISRFARNTKDLLQLIDQLKEKDIAFISKKENIDTNTPSGKFMLTVFAAVAELEREYILQRQKEGIAIAKKIPGKYTGRKRIECINFDLIIQQLQAKKITPTMAIKKLHISKSTFYRRLKDYKTI